MRGNQASVPRMQQNDIYLAFLLTVSLHLQRTHGSLQDLKTTCTTKPVEEGDTGSIQYSFNRSPNLTSGTYLLYIRPGDLADIVSCDGFEQKPTISCDVLNTSFGFTRDGDQHFTLGIPMATLDLRGTYKFGGFINGDSFQTASCNLTVTEKERGTLFPDTLRGSQDDTTMIAAPVVVVCVVVAVIIVVTVFIVKRKRRRPPSGHKEDEVDSSKTML